MDTLRELILNTEKRPPELQLEILESAGRVFCPDYLKAIGYEEDPQPMSAWGKSIGN